MALTLLADAWARSSNRTLYAVTVDHRLRSDSADEAARVHDWLSARGIAHDVLVWHGEKPRTGIQDAARAARYRLIGAWAIERGIAHVLLAHQMEDQAETILMRLARGSGITGLAGMGTVVMRDGVRLCRPLLDIPRPRLRATLHDAEQDWIEDPSNEQDRYARTRYRRLTGSLSAHGAGPELIAEMGRSFAALDTLMAVACRRFLGEASIRTTGGGLTVDHRAFALLPVPVAARVLRDILAEVGGRALAPRGERLERALGQLTEGGAAAFTLGGCRLRTARGRIHIAREPGRARAIS